MYLLTFDIDSPFQRRRRSKRHDNYGVVPTVVQPLHLASCIDALVACEAYRDSMPSRFRLQILDAEGFHPRSSYNK